MRKDRNVIPDMQAKLATAIQEAEAVTERIPAEERAKGYFFEGTLANVRGTLRNDRATLRDLEGAIWNAGCVKRLAENVLART